MEKSNRLTLNKIESQSESESRVFFSKHPQHSKFAPETNFPPEQSNMNTIAQALEGKRETEVTTGQPGSSTETMYAVVWHGKENVRYEEVPKPVRLQLSAHACCQESFIA